MSLCLSWLFSQGPNPAKEELIGIIKFLQSQNFLSREDITWVQNTLRTINDSLPLTADPVINSLNLYSSNQEVQRQARQIRSIKLHDSILQDELAALEAKKQQPFQNLNEINHEIQVIETLRNRHSSFLQEHEQAIAQLLTDGDYQIHAQAIDSLQNILNLM
jgi:chromosome segregation ATPase